MDENKRSKLHQIGFEIAATCGSCGFSQIDHGKKWGACTRHQYDHLKHTEKKRYVSIHILGVCHDYTLDPNKAPADLGTFAEFLR